MIGGGEIGFLSVVGGEMEVVLLLNCDCVKVSLFGVLNCCLGGVGTGREIGGGGGALLVPCVGGGGGVRLILVGAVEVREGVVDGPEGEVDKGGGDVEG